MSAIGIGSADQLPQADAVLPDIAACDLNSVVLFSPNYSTFGAKEAS